MDDITEFWSDFLDWFSTDYLSEIKDVFTDVYYPAIEFVLDKIVSFFDTVFSWIFRFITGEFLGTISGFGVNFFDTVSSSVASTISGGQFIYFVIGALISFPLLKLVISIIRG